MHHLTKIALYVCLSLPVAGTAQSLTDSLDINQVNAAFNANGTFFSDTVGQNIFAHFEVPKGSGVHSLFAGSLWVGGLDAGGNLRIAAQRYAPFGADYQPGPLSLNTAIAHAQRVEDFSRVWKVSRAEIIQFDAWYQAGVFDAVFGTNNQQTQFPGYTIPEAIRTWPGNGRTEAPFDEAEQLAPYFDRNGDGVYDPEDGDFPQIRGDQAVYFIFNDARAHNGTAALPIGVEVHAMAYAYNCADNEALQHSIFLHLELFNRSLVSLDSTYLGFWVDPDLGHPRDDFIGCDVGRGAYYVYNGDDDDEVWDRWPDNPMAPGYGTRPPAQAVVFLSGPKVDADGQDNAVGVGPGESINGVGFGDGIVDNERYGMTHYMHYFNNIAPTVTEPVQGPNYYNYMRGIWLDGSPWVYGGNGYNPGDPNAVRARYHFPGDTDPLGFGTDGVPQPVWNETTSGNTPFDRRGHVGSAGPFTFSTGAQQEVDLAFVFARAETGGAQASVALMQDYIDRVREDFTTPWIRCGGFALSTEPEPQPATVSVYPNPATDHFIVNWQGLNGPAHYRVTDMAGRLQASGTMNQPGLNLEVSGWPAGVYVLHLDSPAGSLTAKLIKQ